MPVEPTSNTSHPSTASGVAYINLVAWSAKVYAELIPQLTAVVGSAPIQSASEQTSWTLATGDTSVSPPSLILTLPNSHHDALAYSRTLEDQVGIWEVGFWVTKGSSRGGTIEDGPLGRVAWVEQPN